MGFFYYYSTYQDKIYNLEGYIFFKFFYHKEITGWTSGFPKIMEISSVIEQKVVALTLHWPHWVHTSMNVSKMKCISYISTVFCSLFVKLDVNLPK